MGTEIASHQTKIFMHETMILTKKAILGDVTDAPAFIQDNEYIKHGYRIDHNTCWQSSRSLCTCHNETVNIWTHLAGSIIMIGFFIGLATAIVPTRFEVGRELLATYSGDQPLIEYIDKKIDFVDL